MLFSEIGRMKMELDWLKKVRDEPVMMRRGWINVEEAGATADAGATTSQSRLWRNVKHEDVYLKGYATMDELLVGLTDYFAFYNGERPHQSLGYKTPDVVYRTADGGGAIIVDKFGGAVGESPVPLRSTGDSPTAETGSKATAKPGQRRPAASEVECAA